MIEVVADSSRHFIITPGRTGSSFLCACLADAGADFGIAAPDRWDRGTGEMKHPEIKRIVRKWLKYQDSQFGFVRRQRKLAAIRMLRRTLDTVQCFKFGNLDLLHKAAELAGQTPIPILNIREFSMTAASTLIAKDDFPRIENIYTRTLQNGIILVLRHGCCVVDHADMMDPARSEWAHEFAAVTGLDVTDILKARDKRLDRTRSSLVPFPIESPCAERAYAGARGLRLLHSTKSRSNGVLPVV